MVSGECEEMVSGCTTGREEVLNTSDHRPVSIGMRIGSIKNNVVRKVYRGIKRWDKLDEGEMNNKYALLLATSLKDMHDMLMVQDLKLETLNGCIEALVDRLQYATRSIPTSKFKKNLKPYL